MNIHNGVEDDIQELLMRREKVVGGLMNVDILDIECTQTVENEANFSKGHADGLVESVREKIKEIKRAQRTEELKHEAELNKVRNTPPTRTTQQGGNATNTNNTTTQEIFKVCAEVKPRILRNSVSFILCNVREHTECSPKPTASFYTIISGQHSMEQTEGEN